MSIYLVHLDTMVLFVTPAAVELLVLRGVLGWDQPISMRVWLNFTMSFSEMKSPVSSASSAKDTKN